jgi:hypothetical protein
MSSINDSLNIAAVLIADDRCIQDAGQVRGQLATGAKSPEKGRAVIAVDQHGVSVTAPECNWIDRRFVGLSSQHDIPSVVGVRAGGLHIILKGHEMPSWLSPNVRRDDNFSKYLAIDVDQVK